jgi:D-alanyl-D-alanine dipeptidase
MKLSRILFSGLLVVAAATSTVMISRYYEIGKDASFSSENHAVNSITSEEFLNILKYQSEDGLLSDQNGLLRHDIMQLTQFIVIKDLDSSIKINLRYATSNNFTGKVIYSSPVCVLRKETAEKLINAEVRFEKLGYHIEIWDAYRPLSAQKVLFAAESNTNYIADPAMGSRHNRGAAVDITLVDENGKEVEMPSGFDDFTIKAHRNNPDMSKEAQKNLATLTSVMSACGFTTISTEWWHFDDSDWNSYPIMDVHLEDFADESR